MYNSNILLQCCVTYMYTPICASYNINILSRLLLSDFDQFVSGQIEEGICSPDSKQKLFYFIGMISQNLALKLFV